uniref:Fmu (Sun) domain protein n=1 Tax=Cyanothece sp. (strain PCC 7425 / ATCC 29141) TaxID=395961 RepID=B8HN56_CYAP4
MAQPSNLLLKFSRRLFDRPEEQEQFIAALQTPPAFHPCILWTRPRPNPLPFAPEPPLDWQPDFVDRLPLGIRPGQDPLHEQGYYYCLDFSSVFAATPLLSLPPADRVLDLCAAPGGKSIFAWRALQPQLLLSNEVIGKRVGMLIANLKRCGVASVAVFSLDPQVWTAQAEAMAQVVLVDAPCSGQSLLAKGEKVPGCFHPVTINQNANRQKRILANAAQVVAPGGYLLYTTCTFAPEENEQVCEWLGSKFPQFQPMAVPALAAYQSPFSSSPCYRLWPQSGLGAGGFTMLMQNTAEGMAGSLELKGTLVARWSSWGDNPSPYP